MARRNPFNATKPAEWASMSKKARKRWNRTHWRPDQWKCDLALKKEATRMANRSARSSRGGIVALAERMVERSNPGKGKVIKVKVPKGMNIGNAKHLKAWAAWFKKHGHKYEANPTKRRRNSGKLCHRIPAPFKISGRKLREQFRKALEIGHPNMVVRKVNPYPYEHSARLVDPRRFRKTSFRRKNVKGGTIGLIMGKPTFGRQVMTLQAVRFRAAHFSPTEAKAWLRKHDLHPIMFEPATKSRAKSWAAESVRKKRTKARRRTSRRTA